MEAGGGGGGTAEDGDQQRPHPSSWGPPRPRECCCTGGGAAGVLVELKLELNDPAAFDLEKAVCSHGLFMMAPNRWDPATRTFHRPLRLCCPSSSSSSAPISVVLRISHPHPRPSALHISVLGTGGSLSQQHQQLLLAQVRRMLRISDEGDRVVEAFHRMHPAAKERGFGRVFRSPTLFEDMVKCILLCNCRLQPRTPQQKELMKSKRGKRGEIGDASPKCPKEQESCSSGAPCISKNPCDCLKLPCPISNMDVVAEGTICPCYCKIGEFPSPEELAGLNEKFLAKRCGLGYRAKRILSLARSIVEGKLQLEELEQNCDILNPSSYDELNERLSRLDGFGPFTRANVLMCMGFYHKIPADSETVRHLKEFHLKTCTIEMIEKYAEDIYGEYAPLQFLAYWSELWNFYEQRFGNLSEMPPSDYQLITARYLKDPKTLKKRRRSQRRLK